ncbi:prolyl oligopeptidase family serine peptidase [Collimonas sp. OK412]|uniref:S9 family peptidase n=1 Tax=Collimonas sp. (strain OK412) TaxID=1801619 RepID=UPI0008E30888|nr:prolyl oligopeptidase family serine peptidase [Collimonas sp. OK412]SFC71949.1 glutamyl peptidase. Serine peptidase. MEROPS family S09D [Collimonas sp. OK412]
MAIKSTLTCLWVSLLAAGVTTAPHAATAASPAAAPASASGYNQPPKEILDVMRAPSPPLPVLSPTRDRMLLVSWQEYPSISRVAAPFLRLAGVRVEPGNHSKHDTPGGYGITPCARSFDLVHIADGAQAPVALPAGACPGRPLWSADGKRFAFENIAKDSVELWIGDASSGVVRRVPGARLNPMLEDQLQWMPDQKTLLVKLVPQRMGPPPPEPAVPNGPSIQESDGGKGQSSTYENRDTLNNRHDEDLFDYYAASQLALVDAASATVTPVGTPGRYESLGPAPDGRHLLVTSIRKPYSYVTTFDRFPQEVEVWDLAKRQNMTVHHIASLPLADRVPIGGVALGPRDFTWRATEPATLVWAEALDGGDWKTKVPARDKLMLQKAPFSSAAVEITRTEQRYMGIAWTEQPSLALMHEYDRTRHWRRSFLVNVDDPQQQPRLLWDLSTDEKYANPGTPVKRQLPNGAWVLRQDGDAIFLSGAGASPGGDRPFLDKLDLKTLKPERLFRSDKTSYEQFLGFAGPDARTFLTWRQSVTEAPNAFVRTLGAPLDAAAGEAAFASTSTAVTQIADPTPVVRQIKKRLVKYKRADGLDLSFTLYTPPGYQEGTRVPTILYAYPLDYADASQAGQTTGSQETFTRLRKYQLLLLAGYAIIDNAAFPIVGDPKKAYDTYMEQLVADATAAVGEAVRLGVADPDRIGVTGHSHGALMTANLLAHSDLFRAGVATSGSYNKTLTPFGFQNEQRSVWEAQDVYLKVSPFFFADKMKTPILIVHGADDANPGTTPLQASKLYEAIRGNGGVTRLVMLPHEPHWYAAMESNEQLVYEMLRWFDRYVKNAPLRTPAAETPATAK